MTRWALAIALASLALPACAASPVGNLHAVAPELGPALAAPLPALAASAAPLASTLPATTPSSMPPGAEEDPAAPDDDDDETTGGPNAAPPASSSSPALALSDGDLKQHYQHDLASLGSISVGRAHAGLLVNGVQMPAGDHWELLDPGRAWGTRETVDYIARCIDRVNEKFPGSPPLPIGHLSAKAGGHLSPHLSHQSGRDADIGYYYRSGATRAFVRATEANLDVPRTWELVRAALRETDIDMILIDTSIQRLLADYAVTKEDASWVDDVFQVRGKNPQAKVRHVKGHVNHIHFRFRNPVAEELGRRVAALSLVHPPAAVTESRAEAAGVNFAPHRARSGDTLVVLARRYGTTVEEIQSANGLKSNALRAGVVYRIPQKVAPKAPPGRGAVAKKPPVKPSGGGRGAAAPSR